MQQRGPELEVNPDPPQTGLHHKVWVLEQVSHCGVPRPIECNLSQKWLSHDYRVKILQIETIAILLLLACFHGDKMWNTLVSFNKSKEEQQQYPADFLSYSKYHNETGLICVYFDDFLSLPCAVQVSSNGKCVLAHFRGTFSFFCAKHTDI